MWKLEFSALDHHGIGLRVCLEQSILSGKIQPKKAVRAPVIDHAALLLCFFSVALQDGAG